MRVRSFNKKAPLDKQKPSVLQEKRLHDQVLLLPALSLAEQLNPLTP
jgi:hypothetical protein